MKTFISNLSGKKYPIAEKVPGKSVQTGVMKEILKVHPDFTADGSLSTSELNEFRQHYAHNLLSKEVGVLTDLEYSVLDRISQNHLITDDVSDIKNPTSRGQRWADRIASFGGSWKFIGLFALFILIWMLINIVYLRGKGFDPYPFILLNLILSCIAAIQAPVIMMSQNRQEEKDRDRAKNDYMINLKSELEIRMLHEKIDHLLIAQEENQLALQQVQIDMMNEILHKLEGKS